ncbi:DUF2637 domain-containing protein [Mycobacterium sp.]|uniref:DUF2637 domain-containing protein n=1 Tax=Mycobacterium sp. TaxID=1785 RepID=UPI003F9CBF9B
MLPYLPRIAVQIGAAAVPPIALLAAVHGIALAVRAGASGRVYRWAVSSVAGIGAGAFAVSFLALRDLMQAIGYGSATAWIFPAIIDTAVAVSTLMLVALGDKPARRGRTVTTSSGAQIPTTGLLHQPASQSAKAHVRRPATATGWVQTSASVQPGPAQTVQDSVQNDATHVDADLASELIASGATTQPVETVMAVLAASRDGASINAAARASGINYRTAQRIMQAANGYRERPLAVVS